ncbi:MAG: AAA family ATPase, partial [Candidatus Midichloria sp.]|nr:AAA family ATPase [Candidatus Midichloria sp.]
YILIDEYDKTVNHLLEADNPDHELIKKTTELMSNIMSACGKDNNYLKKIVLTGIFDSVKKEGQSSFNNVNTYGISDTKFSKSFGFSDDEVDTLINKLQLGNKSAIIKQNIKDWYNGYTVPVSDNAAVQVYNTLVGNELFKRG